MLYFLAGVVIGAIFNAYVLPYINKVIAYFKAPSNAPRRMSFEQRALTKKRTKYNLVTLLLVIPVLLIAFSYYNDIAAFITGQDPAQIADLGAEVLQPLFVTMIYVAAFMVFSAMMASFVEPQLKETAFGTWSRWGIIFCLCFYCCAIVAAGIL